MNVEVTMRKTQERFELGACGLTEHADLNAARNIRRQGPAQLHGEERCAGGTPATREKGGGCVRHFST